MAISTAPGGSARTARLMARRFAPRDLPGTAVRNLENWGLFNLVFWLSTLYVPKFYIASDLHFIGYLSSLLWIIVALVRGYAPIRVPLFMGFVVALQVWFAFTTMYAEVTIARKTVFNPTNYALFIYFLAFVQGSMLVYRSHRPRAIFSKMLIGLLLISALVGYLQILGWGPAKSLLNYSAVFTMQGADGTVIRASGLMHDIGWSVLLHTVGAMLIGSQLSFRSLRWYEWAAIAFLLVAGVLPQGRNQLTLVLLASVWIAFLAIRRHGFTALVGSALILSNVITVLFVFSDRFAYLLKGGTDTLTFRQQKLWSQAINAYREMPFTGIGQEPAFISYQSQIFPNKWVSITFMDGGYMLALAWGGIVGMALLIAATAIGLVQAAVLVRLPTSDQWARGIRCALVILAIHFAVGMLTGNVWGTPYQAFAFALAGLGMPTLRPARPGETGAAQA